MRSIGVVTVGRSDYSIYLPILKRIQRDPHLRLRLIVGGMHLSPEFGMSIQAIVDDGFEIAETVEVLVSSDRPEGIAEAIGSGTIGFAQAYARQRPDILLVLGDRYEMLAAASASLPFGLPLAHIHGGELSEGAIDDAIRHAITKMSHLHFVAMEQYAKRVRQLGEEDWRIVVCGAPALDNLREIRLLDSQELLNQLGLDPGVDLLLVTYHPVTLEQEQAEPQIKALLDALDEWDGGIVFTYPGADPESSIIIDRIERFVAERNNAICAVNLGTIVYYSMLKHALAMVGNSSSGIIEAASFELPVVNVGNRQRGRVRARNVIDVGYGSAEIAAGIRKCTSPSFRATLKGLVNPYGDGNASERIVEVLKRVEIGPNLLAKRFQEI